MSAELITIDLLPAGGWKTQETDLIILKEVEDVFAGREGVTYASYTFDTRLYEYGGPGSADIMSVYIDMAAERGVEIGVLQITIYKPPGSRFPRLCADALAMVIRKFDLRLWSRDDHRLVELHDALVWWRC